MEQKKISDDLPLKLTTKQLASLLQVEAARVRNWCKAGRIKATKQGKTWQISREEAMYLLEKGVGDLYYSTTFHQLPEWMKEAIIEDAKSYVAFEREIMKRKLEALLEESEDAEEAG